MGIYEGFITQFDLERNDGFIETATNLSYYFFLDKSAIKRQSRAGLIKHAHQFCTGDEVSFKLKQSFKDATKKEAYDIAFLNNERRGKLMEEAANNNSLKGILQQIDNKKLFVQHLPSLIWIELEISKWETNIDAIYHNRLNNEVTFKLLKPKINNQLYAVLSDREFLPQYQEVAVLLDAQTAIAATITGSNADGYFATILSNATPAFLACSKQKIEQYNFTIGSIVNVIVKGDHNNGIRVVIA